MARYLKVRPTSPYRNVFIRGYAPYKPFVASGPISVLARKAIERAGVKSARTGAHLFRHSLATAMLRRGASLDEIGRVLRHRHPDMLSMMVLFKVCSCFTASSASLRWVITSNYVYPHLFGSAVWLKKTHLSSIRTLFWGGWCKLREARRGCCASLITSASPSLPSYLSVLHHNPHKIFPTDPEEMPNEIPTICQLYLDERNLSRPNIPTISTHTPKQFRLEYTGITKYHTNSHQIESHI